MFLYLLYKQRDNMKKTKQLALEELEALWQEEFDREEEEYQRQEELMYQESLTNYESN